MPIGYRLHLIPVALVFEVSPLVALCFGDMQGLLIKSARFTETIRFSELNFAELPNGMVS